MYQTWQILIILHDQHCFALFKNFPLQLPMNVINVVNVLQFYAPIWWVSSITSRWSDPGEWGKLSLVSGRELAVFPKTRIKKWIIGLNPTLSKS